MQQRQRLPNDCNLRLPRIALYAGQGIPLGESGEIAWALEQGAFPYRRLEARDVIAEGGLRDLDVLIVPNGVAAETSQGQTR